MKQVLQINDINKQNINLLGGKAKNLYLLNKTTYNIPKWFVVTTKIYENFIIENNLDKKINQIIEKIDFTKPALVKKNSNELKKIILNNNISKEDKKEIIRNFNILKKESNAEFFAVRSSAVGEDSTKKSFAGQMDSFLFISDEEQILKYIKKCWSSLYSERALTYRHLADESINDIRIAVIIQEMIFGDKSGVLFTVNPQNNDNNEQLINATFGIGEGIVSGELATDSFIINKKNNSISSDIVSKKHKIVFNKNLGQGTKKITINKNSQNTSCLTDSEIKKLGKIGKKIQDVFSNPQDIEWTIKDKDFYILQTRPITTLKENTTIIWDNSNIIESFPGITKPLTFSFAQMAWANVFRQTALAMGVSKKVVKNNKDLFENMIGLVNGRVYYNLVKWYEFVSFFPLFKSNKKYMEQMMGVKESLSFEKRNSKYIEMLRDFPGLTKLVYGLIKNYFIFDKEVQNFKENFEIEYKKLLDYDMDNISPEEVYQLFNQTKSRILNKWKIEGIIAYSAMFFYGLVKSLTIKYDLDSKGSLQNDLFCGEKDMDSTKPTKELINLSIKVKQNKELFDFFINNDEEKILEEIYENKDFYWFKSYFEQYLDNYGYRCMNELKLSEKSLKENPKFLITEIKNYFNIRSLNLDDLNYKEYLKRKKAEHIISKKLKFSPLRKTLFFWALKNARKSVKSRENLRLCRTRIFGIVRESFKAIARDFVRRGIIDEIDDIFYLETNEIFNFINDKKNKDNLRKYIKTRKNEYNRFEKLPLPERFETKSNLEKYELVDIIDKTTITQDRKEGVLTGVSCCPGVVKNKVKVILSPDDNVKLNGEILVAEKTDPGWVPLYPSVSGLLIERGSVLSHSAIVARELGLPTIVGIKDLIKTIKDGQEIKMDAGKGIVYLKKKKDE